MSGQRVTPVQPEAPEAAEVALDRFAPVECPFCVDRIVFIIRAAEDPDEAAQRVAHGLHIHLRTVCRGYGR